MTLNPDRFPEDPGSPKKVKNFAENSAETALKFSKSHSPDSLELMFAIQDELEKRIAAMSAHSQELRSHTDALDIVTLLIEQRVSPDIDKFLDQKR